MRTRLTTDPEEAAAFIKRGGLVAFPTETVYGLGANVFDETAIAKIFEAKGRPADNPLIVHISSLDQVDQLARTTPEMAHKLIDTFFPGPLTLVLPKTDKVPLTATAGLDSVGIRMPSREIARRFLDACGLPVAAPSANLSGRPSPTVWEAVLEDLDGRIDCILQGDPTDVGLESTVVDCTGETPVLLRQGGISIEQLRGVVPTIGTLIEDEAALSRSPGLRHKHYSPRARVFIGAPFAGPFTAYIGLIAPATNVDHIRICADVDEYARSLFEFFRECDRRGITTIYCERVPETGLGAALMDRIRRAAE